MKFECNQCGGEVETTLHPDGDYQAACDTCDISVRHCCSHQDAKNVFEENYGTVITAQEMASWRQLYEGEKAAGLLRTGPEDY